MTAALDVARKRRALYPDPGAVRVDAAPAREHVQKLYRWGYTEGGIAAEAGVHQTTVGRVRTGALPVLRARTSDALLATSVYPSDRHTQVPSTGLVRRLNALSALGWAGDDVAALLGTTEAAVTNWRTRPRVLWTSHLRVAELYDRIGMDPGPSPQARSRATRYRWHPPLAWDDIDHPDERIALGGKATGQEVDHVAVARALNGDTSVYLRNVDRRAVADRAVDLGWTRGELAARTGWTVAAADQALVRARRRSTPYTVARVLGECREVAA
ncbi:MAG: hypothetical protein NVSMB4_01650 [Acidimicrobiales bacterium]